jgi:hypothetical protein
MRIVKEFMVDSQDVRCQAQSSDLFICLIFRHLEASLGGDFVLGSDIAPLKSGRSMPRITPRTKSIIAVTSLVKWLVSGFYKYGNVSRSGGELEHRLTVN